MNNYCTETTGVNHTDAVSARTFLQQAVDHYPRLVAFSFTLELPYRETTTDYRSLILQFHTEVWLRIGEYAWKRQQERRHSPPTLLRWLWESVSAPECKMVLLMNLDTLGAVRHELPFDSVLQDMIKIIGDAWQAVTGVDHDTAMNMTPFIINRAGPDAFTPPFRQLKALVQAMEAPVATARTGITG